MECNHFNFYAEVKVARITEEGQENDLTIMPKSFVAEVEVKCSDCGIGMEFLGVDGGFNFFAPTVNVVGDKINLPMRPMNKAREFKKGVVYN